MDRGCSTGRCQAVRSHELSMDSVVLVHYSTTKWPKLCVPVGSCRIITKSKWLSAWTRVTKWEVRVMGRDRPRASCGKKVLNCYSSSVISRFWQESTCVLCSAGYGASAVARKLHRRLFVSCIAIPVRSGSIWSSGDSQGAGSNV